LIFFIVPLVVTTFGNSAFPSILNLDWAGALNIPAPTLILLLTFAVLASAIRWVDLRSEALLLAVVTLLSLALKAFHLLVFDASLYSDFARMWAYAKQFANGDIIPATGIAAERTLVMLVPMVRLFGDSLLTFKLMNVVALLATGLLFYAYVRSQFGVRAALTGYAAYALALEPLLGAAIPTHEIPGAFYAALCFWLFGRLIHLLSAEGRAGFALLVSIGFGIALFLLDLQRNIAAPLLVASMLVIAAVWLPPVVKRLEARSRWVGYVRPVRVLALGLVLPYAVLSLLWAGLAWSGLSQLDTQTRSSFFYSYLLYDAHVYSSSANWTNFGGNHLTVLSAGVPGDEFLSRIKAIGTDVILADLALNSAERPRSFLYKSAQLYDFADFSFYTTPADPQRLMSRDGARDYALLLRASSESYQNNLFLVFGLGLAAWLLLGRAKPMQLHSLLAVTIYNCGMIILGETRPSYSYVTGVILCFYAWPALQGYGASWRATTGLRKARPLSAAPRLAAFLPALLALLLGAAILLAAARIIYANRDSRVVLTPEWSVENAGGWVDAVPAMHVGTFGAVVFKAGEGNSDKARRLRVGLGDLPGGHYRMSFFVRQGNSNGEFMASASKACCIEVGLHNPELASTWRLTNERNVGYFESDAFVLPTNGEMELSLRLVDGLDGAASSSVGVPMDIVVEYLRVWKSESPR
jgi:hypothetical protein